MIQAEKAITQAGQFPQKWADGQFETGFYV
jgi:hypothetical protein